MAKGASGATYTLYATSNGSMNSSNTNYTTARAGSNLQVDFPASTGFNMNCGQNLVTTTEFCFEVFLSFDTSGVVGTIQSATLSLKSTNDQSTTDFVLEARLRDWGATLESADWVAGDSLAGLTLLASMNTSGWATSGYNVLTSEAAFASNINKTGATRIVLSSSRHRAATTPAGLERVGIVPIVDDAQASRLVVVTT